jgi:GTP cyclohydrolase I
LAVHTDNDTLICTPDHRVLTTDGEWIEAQDLKNGQRLASLYRAAETMFSGKQSYSKLIASRYTRWHDGIKIDGASHGVLEHQFVKQQIDGIDYKDGRRFVTHHLDENLWNNLPENLEILSIADHNRAHERTQKLAHSQVRKDAAAIASGRAEVRAKRSASVKAHWDKLKASPEEYQKRTQAMSDGIWAQGARNHVVIGVEVLDYTEDVWCMTVPETELFFANGIAVHNCEHHLADIFGTCSIAYIPNGKIVGLSKLSRLADAFARRLQVQERLTDQIADALVEHLQPVGVGVLIRARHMCMESRGVCQQGHHTVTTALRGAIKDEPQTRSEFLLLAK